MEAEFVGYYLGRSLLSKGTTGLGTIQKPLRERYFAFRKSAENKPGPEVGIRVNPRGLEIVSSGGHPGQDNDEFYDLPSIHFIEAVSFVTVKQKDKKSYGAFIPIQESPDAVQEKLFMQIEKKYSHMTKMTHPPLLACIMRRPSGVKAVDCHMFLIPRREDALDIADMVHRFQERPGHPDFYYGPPAQGGRDFPPTPRDQGMLTKSYERPHDFPPRDLGDSRRNEIKSDSYEIYQGVNRGVELRQDHFKGDEPRGERPRSEPNNSFERDRFPSHKSANDYDYEYTRDRGLPGDARMKPDHRDRDPRDFTYPPFGMSDRDNVQRRSREIKGPNGAMIERDTLGNEFAFDNQISHERQRSFGNRSNDRYDMDRAPIDRQGGVSPRNEFADRPGGGLSPNVEYGGRFPGRPGNRTLEESNGPPPWSAQGRGYPKPPDSGNYDGPPYPRPYRTEPQMPTQIPRGRSPPRGHSSPRSRSPEHDEIYSASNLESRVEVETHGKPVAKVPPNRHAGVRVLPSLPIVGALNQLKRVPKKEDESTSNSIPRDTKPPSYNFNNNNNTSVEDDDDQNPYDNAKLPFRQTRAQSDRSPLVNRRNEPARSSVENKVKSDDYSHGYSHKPAQEQWSFQDEKDKYVQSKDSNSGLNKGYPSKPAYEMGQSGRVGKTGEHAKDLEIEEMFSYLNTDNPKHAEHDFERSLGYLP
ncbi:uncharacterized protein LOC128231645 [Mya arenaria]|nr:uncharacterized protein LOC128231645 [Mya arenaria]XP_052800648.1 uncharacterized protein LOC128231645 [Mya arenaria]